MMHYDGFDGPMEEYRHPPASHTFWRGYESLRGPHGTLALVTDGRYRLDWKVEMQPTRLVPWAMPSGTMDLEVSVRLTNKSGRRCHVPFRRQWKLLDEQRRAFPYPVHTLIYSDEHGHPMRFLCDGETAYVSLHFHVPLATEGYTLMFYTHFLTTIAANFDLPPQFYDAVSEEGE